MMQSFEYMQRDWPSEPMTPEEGLKKDTEDLIRAIEEVKQHVFLVKQFAIREGEALNPNEYIDKKHYNFAREASLTVTKLDEARMWAEQMLKVLTQE